MPVFVNMLKKLRVSGAIALVAIGGVSAPVQAVEPNADIDSIRYTEDMWWPDLLEMVKAGSVLLPRDYNFVVAQPPVNSSEETAAELAYLHELEKQERDEDTVNRIIYENTEIKAFEIFQKEGLLHEENFKTVDFLKLTDYDHRFFILERKKHFARPRPDQLNPSLNKVIENPHHAAYPSGHASQTYMVALVLSAFDPENEQYYKQLSYDVAHRREIAGVHYPSDSIAGRKLAEDVLKALREIPVYEKKFQETKETYIKPSPEALEKFKAYLSSRPAAIDRMPKVQAEWQEIGIELK